MKKLILVLVLILSVGLAEARNKPNKHAHKAAYHPTSWVKDSPTILSIVATPFTFVGEKMVSLFKKHHTTTAKNREIWSHGHAPGGKSPGYELVQNTNSHKDKVQTKHPYH